MVNVMGEKVTIVGFRDVKFTDDNGRQVEGRSYYYTAVADGVQGVMSGKLFVSRNSLNDMPFKPSVGDDVYVFFNRYGKASGFQLVE